MTTTSDVGALFRSHGFAGRLLITFDSLSEFTLSRFEVPGEKLAVHCEADHVHICTTLSTWFQSNDIFQVIEAVRALRDNYKEVILYGHSMGAYGALLLSGPLDATNVVAFAPQFSIDPIKVPFERRFNDYAKTTAFVFDDMLASISRTAPKHVVFDPYFELDRKQFDLLCAVDGILPVRIPFAGHYPGQMLKEGDILRQTVVDLVLQSASVANRRKAIRAARRRSHRYFVERASHIVRRGNFKEALVLVNIAYVLAPSSPSIIETYQALLNSDSRYYGLAHAMVRLVLKEKPEWTFYENTLATLWGELEKHARPIIGATAPRTLASEPIVTPE